MVIFIGGIMEDVVFGFVIYIWPILTLPLVWLSKRITNIEKENDDLKEDQFKSRLHVAQTYLKKDEYREDLKSLHVEIKSIASKNEMYYQKIMDRLNTKADKP